MSFSTLDTIAAIATPPGRGGIGVVRIGGPAAEAITRRLTHRSDPWRPRHATLATVHLPDGQPIDRVIVTFFQAPSSYTGEDVVEISAHGSPVVLQSIVASALAEGARLAAPGEFTLRAYLNGRVDLMQAEAIGDLIDAATPLQARAAFDQLNGTLTETIGEIDRALFEVVARLEASVDFPDEGYHFIEPPELKREFDQLLARLDGLVESSRRGRLLREGLQVTIVGPPNAGKSSLFNALVGTERAIVAVTAGTTRDLVTETVDIDGIRVALVDTAGLRDTADPIEAEGVRRAMRSADVSQLILHVSDLSQPRLQSWPADPDNAAVVIGVGTKSDLPGVWSDPSVVSVSVVTGEGLSELRCRMTGGLEMNVLRDIPAITNLRHVRLVERAAESLRRARAAIQDASHAVSEEFILADLQQARAALEEVTGHRTSDDLLAHIFSKFCIGK